MKGGKSKPSIKGKVRIGGTVNFTKKGTPRLSASNERPAPSKKAKG